MESPELMSLCLKHVPALHGNYGGGSASDHGTGIGDVKVVDAAWVWTEPHSMRLRLKLTIRAGVVDGAVQIQQTLMVTFIIKNQQCPECKREYTSRVRTVL
jgi:nonsense-mediated mRNA decay protein 3